MGEAKEEPGAILVRAAERECIPVVVGRCGESAQREGAIAGITKGPARGRLELCDVHPCGAGELDRGSPVEGQDLGVVLRATERRDPLGHTLVFGGAVCSCDLSVRDVADERVREGELAFALK
jgi:hypothetical protein